MREEAEGQAADVSDWADKRLVEMEVGLASLNMSYVAAGSWLCQPSPRDGGAIWAS